MNATQSKAMLSEQDVKLKKLDNTRFVRDGYEYKVVYDGGLSCFVALYRRPVGKRNFKYYTGFGAWRCLSLKEAMNEIDCLLSPAKDPWREQAEEDMRKREPELRKLDGFRFSRCGKEYKIVYGGGLMNVMELLRRSPGRGWEYEHAFYNCTGAEDVFSQVFEFFGGHKS